MKKILVFVVALVTASSVFAGEGKDKNGGEGRDGKRHEMMQLNLSDEQKVQMKTLREKHRAEKQAMREKHKAEVKTILTPEQSAKLEQKMQERQGADEARRGGNGMKGKRNREEGEREQQ